MGLAVNGNFLEGKGLGDLELLTDSVERDAEECDGFITDAANGVDNAPTDGVTNAPGEASGGNSYTEGAPEDGLATGGTMGTPVPGLRWLEVWGVHMQSLYA